MTGPIVFAIGSIAIMSLFACIITYAQIQTHMRYKKSRMRVAVPARFYSYAACIKARAITKEDDLEGQAQGLIKSIDQDLQSKKG